MREQDADSRRQFASLAPSQVVDLLREMLDVDVRPTRIAKRRCLGGKPRGEIAFVEVASDPGSCGRCIVTLSYHWPGPASGRADRRRRRSHCCQVPVRVSPSGPEMVGVTLAPGRARSA